MKRFVLILAAAVSLSGCGTFAHMMEVPAVESHPTMPPAPPPAAPPGAGIVDSIDPARIDAALKGFVDRNQLVGVSALVFKDDKEVYFGAFGQADREAKVPMARDTLVQIYSMTKPVTGTALMQLYEKGLFKLDDPASKYIPELADVKVFAGLDKDGKPILEAPRRPITVLDLMRHTAGFCGGDGLSGVSYVEDQFKQLNPTSRNNTLADEARILGTIPLVYHPGEKWLYSPAVDMQALMVERLSGEKFDVYLQNHIFGPLKMKETGYYVGPERRARLAQIYDWHEDGSMTPRPNALDFPTAHWPLTPGSYGLVSTVDDYMRFVRMLADNGTLDGVRILKPETVRLMSTNQLPNSIASRSWLPSKGRVGFGLDFAVRLEQPQGTEAAGTVGEFFWDGAAYTLFWVDPVNHITAVLFDQYMPFGKVPVHPAFRGAVYALSH